MSIIKVNTITGIIDMPKDVRIKGGRLGVNFTVDSLGALPDSTSGDSFRPSAGDWFWDSGNTTLKLYLNDSHGWKNIGLTDSSGAGGSSWARGGDRGMMMSGASGGSLAIDYFSMAAYTSSADFGDLSYTYAQTSASTANRILVFGYTTPNNNVIEYLTPQTPGDATSFGNLTGSNILNSRSGYSDGVYGLYSHWGTASVTPFGYQMQYVTVDTTGNASLFGNTSTYAIERSAGGDDTRYIMAGGFEPNGTRTNVIDYVTTTTTGNSSDFGDLAHSNGKDNMNSGAITDDTYSVFAGGYTYLPNTQVNVIEYVTTQTTGNASDFGDMTTATYEGGGASNNTTGVMAGYRSNVTQIDYITIATPGNAADFGDMLLQKYQRVGASGGES